MPNGRKRRQQRLAQWVIGAIWPNQRSRWTREGGIYTSIWLLLLLAGLSYQINLILLVAGLAAGPIIGSIFVGTSMVKKLRVSRRVPSYVFSGEPLTLDYTLDNDRRYIAALALIMSDELVPIDRAVSGSVGLSPRAFFPRVPGRSRARIKWQGIAPRRGKYKFRTLDLATRAPFGLLERRVSLGEPDELMVYPTIGHLTRRWQWLHREASETRRGSRHDRSTQQQEYHGLRDYRPGDSYRWIHWRTSARLGQPMVKEFEQQHEQDLAILLDPWLPRTKVTNEQREAVEDAIKFAATVCFETCRHPGRRLLLGWTGPTPGVSQGPASVKLLHELLEQLATLRPSPEGGLSALLDVVPPSTLRESIMIVVSTRPINLSEEAEGSTRLSATSVRGLMGRVTLLDASKGGLADYIQFADHGQASPAAKRPIEADPIDPDMFGSNTVGMPSWEDRR